MNTRRWIPQAEKTHEIPDAPPSEELKKVLLLEDDVQFAGMVREFLEAEKFSVTVVSNGAAGLKRIVAGDYDVILCDMVMPNFSGDMFYFSVQKMKPKLCQRFIFMTGHRGDPKIDAFIRNVQGLMIFKPFPLPDLMVAVNTMLHKVNKPEWSK